MAKSHLKRLAAPRTWKVKRKGLRFITRPNPSGHTLDFCLSINTVLKDLLGYANSAKEVKFIVHNQEVIVDGKRITDPKHALGFMSVLQLPKLKESYRLLIDTKGCLVLHEINGAEVEMKPVEILNKRKIKGGKIQLNLGAGINLLVEKEGYKCGESLIIKLPDFKIAEHVKFDKGTYIFLTGGSHVGEHGVVESYDDKYVEFKSHSGDKMNTQRRFAIAVGAGKPAISMLKDVA